MIFGGFEKFTTIDYPGKVACIVYTIGCNFRCPYCHNPELVDETVETRILEQDVLFFLLNRKQMLEGIVITGGEPTMHGDDLLAFMKKVKDLGFLVKLDTNGTNPVLLQRAIHEGLVDYVAMDIKAPLSKYSQTVARPVDIDAIRKSIQILISSGVKYEFRTTVVKSLLSPDDFDEIGKEIKGAERYFLQTFIPRKLLNPQFMKKVSYSPAEFDMLCKKMGTYVRHCAVRT
ncbi:MAG: anaerobic ribonucleoside-triphosphate reductase activating protein [bacterium]